MWLREKRLRSPILGPSGANLVLGQRGKAGGEMGGAGTAGQADPIHQSPRKERTGFSLKELGTNPKPTRPIKEKSPIKENNPSLADARHALQKLVC